MKSPEEYRIPFVGLSNGVHYFNYEIDDAFLGMHDSSPVNKGRVFVDLSFEKRERVFTLIFDVSGQVIAECDLCSVDIDLPIHGHYKMFVKLGEAADDEAKDDEDVIWLSAESTHLDLNQLLYEFIVLSVPLAKACEDPGNMPSCDRDVFERLKSGDTDEQDPDGETDPRWDALKSLK